jgi:hypothetical protein
LCHRAVVTKKIAGAIARPGDTFWRRAAEVFALPICKLL